MIIIIYIWTASHCLDEQCIWLLFSSTIVSPLVLVRESIYIRNGIHKQKENKNIQNWFTTPFCACNGVIGMRVKIAKQNLHHWSMKCWKILIILCLSNWPPANIQKSYLVLPSKQLEKKILYSFVIRFFGCHSIANKYYDSSVTQRAGKSLRHSVKSVPPL